MGVLALEALKIATDVWLRNTCHETNNRINRDVGSIRLSSWASRNRWRSSITCVNVAVFLIGRSRSGRKSYRKITQITVPFSRFNLTAASAIYNMIEGMQVCVRNELRQRESAMAKLEEELFLLDSKLLAIMETEEVVPTKLYNTGNFLISATPRTTRDRAIDDLHDKFRGWIGVQDQAPLSPDELRSMGTQVTMQAF